jgi:hypothetical protein
MIALAVDRPKPPDGCRQAGRALCRDCANDGFPPQRRVAEAREAHEHHCPGRRFRRRKRNPDAAGGGGSRMEDGGGVNK